MQHSTSTLLPDTSSLSPAIPTSNPSSDLSLSSQPTESVPALRRSTRAYHPPPYLEDYDRNQTSTSAHTSPYHLFLVHSYDSLAPAINVILHDEPKSFVEAVKHMEWRDAMQFEIPALESIKPKH